MTKTKTKKARMKSPSKLIEQLIELDKTRVYFAGFTKCDQINEENENIADKICINFKLTKEFIKKYAVKALELEAMRRKMEEERITLEEIHSHLCEKQLTYKYEELGGFNTAESSISFFIRII